jgi:hypothetical protein
MAKGKRTEQLEDAIEDARTVASGDYPTKAELESALDRVVEICDEVMPELSEDGDAEPDELDGED